LADNAVPEPVSVALISRGYLFKRLQWLMLLRVVFTTVLLGSTIVVQALNRDVPPITPPLLMLYGLIGGIYALTFFYILVFKRFGPSLRFAYGQIGVDTLFVTSLIYVTGGIASVFSFLYLVVIVYASILLYKQGSLIMATLCGLQYAVMISLEYSGILKPFYTESGLGVKAYEASFVVYNVTITIMACFWWPF
jgi:two-component system, NtrC family, sensor histidine kinase HydH